MLGLQRFHSVAEFNRHAGAFLMERETENNVMLGIISYHLGSPEPALDTPYMAVVEDDGEIVMLAMRTPPFGLLISGSQLPAAISLVAQDVRAVYGSLSGVLGIKDLAHAFAAEWQKLTGERGEVTIAERLFRLDEVIPVEGVPGMMRDIEEADRDLVAAWLAEFQVEALNEQATPEMFYERIDQALTNPARRLAVWVDGGRLVSLVGCSAMTPNGARVGPVYTPPELRGRGYASACVAEFSQRLLDEGRQYCCLYTDLANPTSNKIYQNVGYRPVADFDKIDFRPG